MDGFEDFDLVAVAAGLRVLLALAGAAVAGVALLLWLVVRGRRA